MLEAAWRSAEAGGRVCVANASWMKTEDEVKVESESDPEAEIGEADESVGGVKQEPVRRSARGKAKQ